MKEFTQNKVMRLFITKNDSSRTRFNVEKLSIDEKGVVGDKFYAKNVQRAILLTSTRSYELAKENGVDISMGSLGENVLIDFNLCILQTGDILKIGKVKLEITQNCTICQGLSSLDIKLPELLKHDRGVFAKVVKDSSTIHIGDNVEILNH